MAKLENRLAFICAELWLKYCERKHLLTMLCGQNTSRFIDVLKRQASISIGFLNKKHGQTSALWDMSVTKLEDS